MPVPNHAMFNYDSQFIFFEISLILRNAKHQSSQFPVVLLACLKMKYDVQPKNHVEKCNFPKYYFE